jgi:hypothetical protein
MPCKKYWIPANPYHLWKDDPDVLMIKKKYFFHKNYKQIKNATIDDIKDSIAVHLFASINELESIYKNIFGELFASF